MADLHPYRVLVLADPYSKPSFAPRLRSICEHLGKKNWQVDVFTEQWQPLEFEYSNYTITTIPLYKQNLADWAVKTFWSLMTNWKERTFAKEVTKRIEGKQYDIVFCTTFSTFPLCAAVRIAKERNLPLFVDIRDIDEQAPNSQYQSHRQWWARPFRGWYRRTQNRRRDEAIRLAQHVTTISPWHVRFLKKRNDHVSLVWNGFDRTVFYPRQITASSFDIIYTGRIYESELQDPRCFFEGLSLLPELRNMRVVWYTNKEGQKRVSTYVKQYNIQCPMVYHDYVAPQQVPQILNSGSIVLVFSHPLEEKGPHGIMTTKFYEALGVEKPVLCAPSDEECLAQVIQLTNAGIAARTPQEVASFIMDRYQEWQKQGFTQQPVVESEKETFARQTQAEHIEQLLTETIQNASRT